MEVHNYTENIVKEIYEDIMLEHNEVCQCEKCKMDIIAITLNKLPPKYVVTTKGSVYAKVAQLQLQIKMDVVREITKALEIVKNKPQH